MDTTTEVNTPFTPPFTIAKTIWTFLLKQQAPQESSGVKIYSCLPNKGGLVDGWTCLLESDTLSQAITEKERELIDAFQNFPDNLLQNKKIPDLIKYRKTVSTGILRQHWQSVVRDNLVKVTITDPIGLGMCQPLANGKRDFTTTLVVKGIWVSRHQMGALIEMGKIHQSS